MELVGVHPTCSLKKTSSSFEEAHHWNIQAKFYSVKVPHIAICIYDHLYGVQDIEGVRVWIFQKNSSVAPFSLFIFFFSFFYFLVFFGGLNGSFYLTLICHLWGLLNFVLFGIFFSLK